MNYLKSERTRRGWSIRELAKLAGVSHQTIHNIENGRGRFSSVTLMKLAEILNCKPEDFIDEKWNKKQTDL